MPSTQLLSAPTFSWPAAPFGLLYTYSAGSTTPKTTYSDAAGLVPNINPVELDSTGSATVRLGSGSYKFVLLDATNTVTLWTQDNYDSIFLTAAAIGAVLYPQTAAELAVSVTPTSTQYSPGDWRRYGAVLNGVTDDTAALQRWATVGGNMVASGAFTALITAEIALSSNSTIRFTQGAGLLCATPNINFFHITAKTNVVITGCSFSQTVIGTSANLAAVLIEKSTYCSVEYCTFSAMQCCAVRLIGSSHCRIQKNYCFGGASPPISSSANIAIESSGDATSSQYNVVRDNSCFAVAEFGVSCWDPYTGVSPYRNLIAGNRIFGQHGYGVLVYMPAAGDSYNEVINNDIEAIQAYDGLIPNTDSGAGIYVVGAGAGGTQVIGNNIRNCCTTTSTTSLAPGGIGVAGTSANTTQIVVSGNVINNMTKYHGIIATGLAGGISITGNVINMPASNITGDGIRVTNCANPTVTGNNVLQLNTTTAQRGILVFGQTGNCTSVAITGNTIHGGHQSYIETVVSGGGSIIGLTITGNTCDGGDNSCIPLLFGSGSATDVLVTGNYFSGGTATVISQTACTNVRYGQNRVKGTGTAVLTTVGTCTGSFYDITNAGTTEATTANGGTGFIIEQFAAVIPASGTHAVGDKRVMSVPAVGSPKGWRCTVAGTSGTWVSEGNL